MIINLLIILVCICETIALVYDYLKVFKNKVINTIIFDRIYKYLNIFFLISM